MAHFIPTTCPHCEADMTLDVPQRKDDVPRGWIRAKCWKCGIEHEYYVDTPESNEISANSNNSILAKNN